MRTFIASIAIASVTALKSEEWGYDDYGYEPEYGYDD